MTDPQYLTIPQVAKELNVTVETVQHYCRDGMLPGAVKAGFWLIPRATLMAFKRWIDAGKPAGGPTPPTEGTL